MNDCLGMFFANRIFLNSANWQGPENLYEVQRRADTMTAILQHYFNPLHIYCRLRDLGMAKELATCLCRFYERFFFKHLCGRE